MLHDDLLSHVAPAPGDLSPTLAAAVAPGPLPANVESLTMHLCAEQLLAGWCTALSSRSPAPMLRQIFVKLAVDTSRRADTYAQDLRRAVRRDPAALPAVLRLALWVMRNDDGDRVTATVVADGRRTVRPEDPHCIRRMLRMRRMLAG